MAQLKELILGKPEVLGELDDANGILTYKGVSVSEGVVVDTFSPLAFDQTYETLIVRSNWYEVPIYITDDEEVLMKLTSNELYAGEPKHSVSLEEYKHNITGMPVLVLKVINNGVLYTCYSYNYTNSNNNSYSAGWYDDNGSMGVNVPTFNNMEFNNLQICNDIIDLTEDLSDKAMSGLDTISRIINVSVDAMGGLGVVPDGVQRLTNAPIPGRRYAAVTNRNITFPLPTASWAGTERGFWVDLDCTSSVNLTFSDDVCYEDGNNVDTTRGRHRLHVYAPAGATMWTVAETESYTEITEDYLPEYTIPFHSCTADQIRAVLKLGYSDGNGNWCVRRKDGIIQTWFSIGDMHPVTLTDGQEVTMRIIGIQHDDLPNGGKAMLSCDFVEPINVTESRIGSNNLYDTWENRQKIKNIADLFPSWLLGLSVCVKKPCCRVNYNTGDYITHTEITTDVTWLLSQTEVGIAPIAIEHDGTTYPVFTDNASRIRFVNGLDTRVGWLLRTAQSDSRYGIGVNGDGVRANSITSFPYSNQMSLYVVGFCLNVD